MCVVSMVIDHYWHKWQPYVYPAQPNPPVDLPQIWPYVPIPPSPPAITPEEINELRQLLDRARQYDKEHNQPDCELEEKKERLRRLAEELGVKIDFL